MQRGGSWNNNPRNCRAANRNRNEPEIRNDNIGFRAVVSLLSTLQCESRRMGIRRESGRVQPVPAMGNTIRKSNWVGWLGRLCRSVALPE
ncbi:MAG: hypothetical protein KME26_12160 [Oscillatoria princeps RMCB-10]|nr:hypothetical protein [Oscillatoria princeps RMCB-10]